MGVTRSRSLCITPNISAPSLYQLETRPPGHTDRCTHPELADNPRVCFPIICLNRPMFTAGDVSRSRAGNPNIPSLANSALASTSIPAVYRSSHSTPTIRRSLNQRQPHPLNNLQLAVWNLSANVKQQAFQQKLEEILLEAWR